MNTPNPVTYQFCRNAWENYRNEEQLPVQSLAVVEYGSDKVEGGIRRVLKAIRGLFGTGTMNKQYPIGTSHPAAVAK